MDNSQLNLGLQYICSLGFSKKFAQYLSERYKGAFVDTLRNSPEQLYSVIDRTAVESARILDAKKQYAAPLFRLLSPFNIPDTQIMAIYDTFKTAAIEEIKKNPYCMVRCSQFKGVDDFALSLGEDVYSERRIKAAIIEILDNCEKTRDIRLTKLNGSMCIPKAKLAELVREILGYYQKEFNWKLFQDELMRLHLSQELYIPRNENIAEEMIYPATLSALEFGIARNIRARLQDNPNKFPIEDVVKAVEQAEVEKKILLSEEQFTAVKTALTSPITVITGGPGTGKTAVQKIILEAFEWLEKDSTIRLLAPTGQAAKRMAESTGYPASTIHNALGLVPSQKKTNLNINEGLVVIDESSMIDADLFLKLLKGIKTTAKIIIVGDINQLPAIGVGSVLRELIKAKNVPMRMLTKVFRQASDSPVAYNAARIKAGNQDFIENECFDFLETFDADTIADTATEAYRNAVEKEGLDNVICLTAFRQHTDTSVNALNIALRNAIRPELKKENIPSIRIKDTLFYEGDKVVFGKNKKNLVNGELGYILKVCSASSLKCKFGEKEAYLNRLDLECLDLAYAQTVHKSQGAEYKIVILVVDEKHKSLLSKELVYTAVTRSKSVCHIVCEKKQVFCDSVLALSPHRDSCLNVLI